MKFYNKNSSSKLWIDDNKNLKFTSEYNFLNKCFKNKNFKYFGARKVSNFIFKNNSISSINVKNLYRNKYETHKVSNLILCAGTLNTARIYLKSIQKHKAPKINDH